MSPKRELTTWKFTIRHYVDIKLSKKCGIESYKKCLFNHYKFEFDEEENIKKYKEEYNNILLAKNKNKKD